MSVYVLFTADRRSGEYISLSAASLGNVQDTTLTEIWRSDKLYRLYRLHLTGHKKEVPVCYHCQNYKCFTPKEDNLDQDKETILKRLEERERGRE